MSNKLKNAFKTTRNKQKQQTKKNDTTKTLVNNTQTLQLAELCIQ